MKRVRRFAALIAAFLILAFAHARAASQALIPAEPVLGLSNNIGLVRNAPHPNAGKLLFDFNLSVEGQIVLRNGNRIPASAKVEAPEPGLKQGFRVNYVSPAQGVAPTEKGEAALKEIWSY